MSSFHMAALVLLLLITYLPSPAISQPNLPPITPTIAECGPRIIPLAMCAPFVQGISMTPSQSCCDSLGRVNEMQPRCLCILLNNSALSSGFPVNATLAMQLPHICSVDFDVGSCTGAPSTSISPTPQVSLGSTPTNSTSTMASSPMAPVTPKSGFMGMGFHPANYAMRSKGALQLWLTVMLITFTYISTSTLY